MICMTDDMYHIDSVMSAQDNDMNDRSHAYRLLDVCIMIKLQISHLVSHDCISINCCHICSFQSNHLIG